MKHCIALNGSILFKPIWNVRSCRGWLHISITSCHITYPTVHSTPQFFTPPFVLSRCQHTNFVLKIRSKHIPEYILTYSMVQSPSWAANWFAASQDIPCIPQNPKVHYRTHKRTPPVSILGKSNPVHMPTSNLLEIHPNIIHPSTRRSPQWSPSLRFPHQYPINPSPPPYPPVINQPRLHREFKKK